MPRAAITKLSLSLGVTVEQGAAPFSTVSRGFEPRLPAAV